MDSRETIEVTVTLNDDGIYLPRSFRWNEKVFRISDIGRRWQVQEAEHMLVMVEPISNVHELIRDADGRWYIKTSHDQDTILRRV
jgi:hypothetical protein